MSNTQGEPRQSLKTTIIGGAIAIVIAVGAVAGVAVASDNARAQAAQEQLLAGAKTDSITMQAATMEDATVAADATQADAINHTDQVAAQAQAAYDAKIAAQKAAAAKAAALKAAQEAAAAQQAAQQQEQTQQASGDAPSAPTASGAPAGTPVPFYPSADPNNANHGDYADPGSFCASHSASTVNGVPVCD